MGKSYIYIYIANGAPAILNVDNEADGEALEKLGAIRMPESMATEVFGNNAKYADNTTCVITENPDNAEFPFNVRFDSSKIMAKPKMDKLLTDSYMSKLSFPQTTNYINIPLTYVPTENLHNFTGYYAANFTAPANGWIYIAGNATGTDSIYSSSYVTESKRIYGMSSSFAAPTGFCASLVPAIKGVGYDLRIQHCNNITARFIYAQGEI